MASDDRYYTGVENADTNIKDIEFQPSTIETIDTAFYEYVDKEFDLHVDTNRGWEKVKTIWVSA